VGADNPIQADHREFPFGTSVFTYRPDVLIHSNPMVIRWPVRIRPDATPRPQFHHCNDVARTIYEIVGITPPRVVNGVAQDPIDGVSFMYAFDDLSVPGSLRTQYFEIMGSRGIYHDEWLASAFGPRVPWVPGLPPDIENWTPDHDQWEL
jgi:arylsulfatase A-like enzyme